MHGKISKLSLKHRIAQEIKRLVFAGDLKPGEKITEIAISKDLDVSRTSVREAMLMLELEGVVISSPYRETRVATITQEEVLELLIPIRVDIETFSLRRGRPHWKSETKDQLMDIVDRMRDASRNDDFSGFIETDICFHELIVRSSRLESAIRIWESIVYRIRMHFLYQNSNAPRLLVWLADHEALAGILLDPDISLDAACASLKEHIIETNIPDVYTLDHFDNDSLRENHEHS